MPYFTRVFADSEMVPVLEAVREALAQWAAQVNTNDEPEEWEVAEIVYDEEASRVEVERYIPATDGLFEEDIRDYRTLVEHAEDSDGRTHVLERLEETRQIVAFRVPDDADDTVFGPLNAAMDAVCSQVGGLTHAEGEGFYEGSELILPTD